MALEAASRVREDGSPREPISAEIAGLRSALGGVAGEVAAEEGAAGSWTGAGFGRGSFDGVRCGGGELSGSCGGLPGSGRDAGDEGALSGGYFGARHPLREGVGWARARGVPPVRACA